MIMEDLNLADFNAEEINKIINLNDKLNKSMIYTILKFVKFLRKNGYIISTSSVIYFCDMLDKFDIANKSEYKLISKSIFCSSRLEYDSYNKLFDIFYSFDGEYALRLEIDEKIRESKDKIKNIESCYNNQLNELVEILNNVKYKIMKQLLNENDLKFSFNINKTEICDLLEEASPCKENLDFLKELLYINDCDIKNHLIYKNINLKELKISLEKAMLLNFSKNNDSIISEWLIEIARITSVYFANIKTLNQNHDRKVNQLDKNFKKEVDYIKNTYDKDISNIKYKLSTINHREEYVEGCNSVIEFIRNSDKTISALSEVEYSFLKYYINLNSSKFRTKIGRSMKRYRHKTFDIKKTVQESIKFNGTPVRYYYKKPIVKKYKLVCVLDISGSVSKYLEVLLAFFFEISSVFNGGVEFYGFVSDIMDFTALFRRGKLKDVVESIKGYRGYSNYGKAIEDFYNYNYKNIDSNTIMIYFGDARNNKNEDNANLLKLISEKVKYSVWLNPEEKEKWNSGDSIIVKYSKHMNDVYCVNTTEQLIDFLNNFEIKTKNNL